MGEGGRGSGPGFGERERHPQICGKRVNREQDLPGKWLLVCLECGRGEGGGGGAGPGPREPGISGLGLGNGRDLGNWGCPGAAELPHHPQVGPGSPGVTWGDLG